jgi:hypothetical protein
MEITQDNILQEDGILKAKGGIQNTEGKPSHISVSA